MTCVRGGNCLVPIVLRYRNPHPHSGSLQKGLFTVKL